MKSFPIFSSPRGVPWPSRAPERGRAGIALLAVAVIAAVAVALLYWEHATVERALVAAFQRHQLTTAHSLAAGVEEVFTEVEEDMQELARHPETLANTPDIQAALDAHYETHTDILNSVTVVAASGARLFRSPATPKQHSVAQWPEFIAVRETMKPHVGEPATSVIDATAKVMRVFVPLVRDGKFDGAIYASVNLKRLWAKCLKRPETGRKTLCWVADNGGMLLYHTNRAYWYRNWDDIERELHASQEAVPEEEERAKALRRRVQDGEEGMDELKNDLAGGVAELIAFTPVRLGNERYGLAVVTPKSEIAGPIEAHVRATYALIAGIVVFLTVAGGIVYRGAAVRARLAEEKARPAELAKSRRYLQTIIDAIGDPVTVIGRDHRIALANRAAWEKASGDDPVERGMTCYQLSHGYDTPCNGKEDPCPLEQVFATKGPVSTTHLHHDPDGNEVVAEVAAWPIFDEAGEIVQVVEHCRDVTERVRAEEALRLQAEIMANMSEGVYLVRADDGVIVYANPKSEEIFGYGPDEMVGEHISIVNALNDKSPEETAEEIMAFLAEHGFWRGEVNNIKKDGTPFWCYASVTVFEHPQHGKVLVGVHTDITERKRAEAERRKLEEQIQQAQKLESLGVLAGGIAHDFNNLLVGIMGNAEMALTELPPESPARYSIGEIETAGQRAADLCRQMLAYSGKGRFVVEALDLSRLVEEMAHLLDAAISKKAVLKYDLSGELPAVDADATQLRQIVMNLITNASEAIGDKSGVISVRTGMMEADRAYLATTYVDEDIPEGAYVYMEVADTGCGMDQETLSKIFDPFFSTKFTGRGLGLAAVLGIVRCHRGTIKIYSEPGKGTTFKVLLPCSDEPAADAREQKAADGAWHSSATALVVDDEETARTIAKRMLELAGLTVLTAADGRDAVDVFRERAGEIDAVLLDLTMPHMGGEETFTELRRIRPGVRVVLSSGYTEEDAVGRFAGKGLAGFIQKPYRRADLIAALRTALEGSEGK